MAGNLCKLLATNVTKTVNILMEAEEDNSNPVTDNSNEENSNNAEMAIFVKHHQGNNSKQHKGNTSPMVKNSKSEAIHQAVVTRQVVGIVVVAALLVVAVKNVLQVIEILVNGPTVRIMSHSNSAVIIMGMGIMVRI